MKKALLIIDVQNDFLENGALPVLHSFKILPIINELIRYFEFVFATRDWHPKNHVSFAHRWQKKVGENINVNGYSQPLWPDHCIENEWGSQYPDTLLKEHIYQEFLKGSDCEVDSYSCFFDTHDNISTNAHTCFQTMGITDLYVVGLATDYCVKQTVLDALKLNYNVHIVLDACCGVNVSPKDDERALIEMKDKGAQALTSAQLLLKKSIY